MKIGIDVDGVLANFTKSFHKVLLEVSPKREKEWQGLMPSDWDYSNFKLSKEEMGAAWGKIAEKVNFWESLSVLPHTEILPLLVKKHDVYFITNRAKSAGNSLQDQTAFWLHQCYGIQYPTVIVAKNKGEVAEALGIEQFIDDNVPNCLDLQAHGINVWLQDGTWNRENTTLPRVKSLNNFGGTIFALD